MLVGVCVATAGAQDADARGFSVGAGAGVALPFHGDYDFTARGWQADARLDVSRHFAIGVFFDEWRHSEEDVLTNQRLFGPNGPIGLVDRVDLETRYATRAVGINFLGRVPLGRVVLSGGGGAGALFYQRDFTQTLTGCVSDQPGVCDNARTSNRFTNSGFITDVQAGADVAITSRLAVTGLLRVIVAVQDIGSGHMSVNGGARLFF